MLKLKVALALTALVVVVATMGSGQALNCNGTITQVDTPAATFYIDDRGVDVGGVWVYQESNGTAGLQSGGNSVVLGDLDADSCAEENPDTLIV